jgi:hypothetical protein
VAYEPGPGSLEFLLQEIKKLNLEVADLAVERGLSRPRVYLLRRTSLEFPCIYPWVDFSQAEFRDAVSHRHRDTFVIPVRAAVAKTVDSDEMSARLVRFGDCLRDVYESSFRIPQPLNNAAKWAERPSLQFFDDVFGDEVRTPVLQVVLQARVDRDASVINRGE